MHTYLKCPYYGILKVPKLVLESPTLDLHASKVKKKEEEKDLNYKKINNF